MFNHKHYVPILKGKDGEFRSLEDLDPGVKESLTPLIEIPPIPWDYKNEQFQRSIDDHVQRIPDKLVRAWADQDRPMFLDFYRLSDLSQLQNGQHPLEYLASEARSNSVKIVPVTGINRSSAFQTAVRNVVNTDQSGLCIRIDGADYDRPGLQAELDTLINNIGVNHSEVDLILDLKPVSGLDISLLALTAKTLIRHCPYVTQWRTLTFASGAFPFDLRDFRPNSVNPVLRSDWEIWQSLAQDRGNLPKLPTFGDYAISHPELSEVDPRIITMSASLRYTGADSWLIFKEKNVQDHGFEQFNDICKKLVKRPEYPGPKFSWGDEYIYQCSQDQDGPGNAQTWRQVGTTHHLTMVVDQIANFPGI